MDFSETIAVSDLKVGRCRQLFECMKPYVFQVLYVLCFTRLRYQVSVYRTIGPLVLFSDILIFLIPNRGKHLFFRRKTILVLS